MSPQPIQAPQPELWAVHKDLIVQLYKHHALNDVIRIMQHDHNFVATVKMYKSRLEKWGVQKNLTRKQVGEFLRQARVSAMHDSSGNPSFHFSGGKVDERRLRAYLRRSSERSIYRIFRTAMSQEEEADAALGEIRSLLLCSYCSKSPQRPVAHFSTAVEECTQMIRAYVSASLKSTLPGGSDWNHSINSRVLIDSWCKYLASAESALLRGQTNDGFRLINLALERYEVLLRTIACPLLHTKTYVQILDLYTAGFPDVANMVIRYMCGLARVIQRTSSHPVYFVLKKANDLSEAELLHVSKDFLYSTKQHIQSLLNPMRIRDANNEGVHCGFMDIIAHKNTIDTMLAKLTKIEGLDSGKLLGNQDNSEGQ